MSSQVTVPFPASGGYIAAIRASSSALCKSSGVIISQKAINQLLHSPAFSLTFDKLSKNHGLALPLNFPSQLSELNLISVLSLINIGSGYRVPLHAHTGRGAWDSIRALILSLFITSTAEDGGDLLSAKAMKSISVNRVAEAMQVPTHIENPHESIPGVVIGELGGPLYELAKLVTSILNQTGEILVSQGYPDLGTFVLEVLMEGEKVGRRAGESVDIETVLEKLIRAIPAFQDMSLVDGQPVYIFKKVLFLLNGISLRFSSRFQGEGAAGHGAIPVPDTSNLPIFSDNVIPSILVHLGIIDLSECKSTGLRNVFLPSNIEALLQPPVPSSAEEINVLKIQPPKDGPVLSESDAYILRASAVDACEMIVKAAHESDIEGLKGMTPPEINAWLWAGAKDRPDYRQLERFVLRGTAYF